MVRLLASAVGMTALLCMSITSSAFAQQPPKVNVNLAPPPAAADESSALAEKLQNPIADLISVPFQNTTNFNVGSHRGVQDILNIQPVIPIHVSEDWTIITRTIATGLEPVLAGRECATVRCRSDHVLGLSPARSVNGWTFGGGVIVELPTITNKALGSNVWGMGPAVVGVRMAHPWVYGLLVNIVFSLGGTSGPGGTKYTLTTINP